MANKNDKRARKKSHRDQAVAQQWAAYKRRRFIRWTAGALVLLLIIGASFALIGGDDEPGNDRNTRTQRGDSGDTDPAVPPSEQTPEPLPTAVACGAEAPPPADPKQYDAPPEKVIEDGVDYGAVFKTSCGDITVDLLEETAPQTVNNFVFLAQEGYFDGLIFHRVAEDFVIQAGDPNGLNGVEPDGPGYSIPDELPDATKAYQLGTLAMANAGPNTGGSQFFFVVSESAGGLQPDYAVFGQASEDSEETLAEIAAQETFGGSDPARAEMPKESVYIESIEITES